MRILVVGASGYIGGRLASVLEARGHELVLMSRDARPLAAASPAHGRGRRPPGRRRRSAPALEGVEVAYYLAHSMGSGERGFAERDRNAARNFASAAARAGVRRIVYLGGLGDEAANLSPHLASRQQTGRRARRSRRAGHRVPGRDHHRLGKRVVRDPSPPDRAAADHDHAPLGRHPHASRSGSATCSTISSARSTIRRSTGIVEIGGPDILSYGDMMRTYARLRGLRRLMIPVPVLTPRLSSYWVSLVSPVPAGIARPLIEGLRNEVVVRDPRPAASLRRSRPRRTTTPSRRAIDRSDRHAVESTWFDSLRRPRPRELPTMTRTRG